MLTIDPAKRVVIYLGEDDCDRGEATYKTVLDYLRAKGVSEALVMRGVAGFGSDGRVHTTAILRLMENLPIKIEFIESSTKVDEILPTLSKMAAGQMIEIHDTMVVKKRKV